MEASNITTRSRFTKLVVTGHMSFSPHWSVEAEMCATAVRDDYGQTAEESPKILLIN
jgi:hypothetical protein